MSENSPFLYLEQSCDEAVDWVRRQLINIHLNVVRTFDLQIARHAHDSCPCPHHGTEQCDCQMVVLLVYGNDRHPVSIVAHGYNCQTWFSMVDTPQQRADPRTEEAIRMVLVPHITATLLNQAGLSHAS
ncbi:MAG TPA: hypothetical protein VMW34_04605 [Anaerolineales bacterium]|jgi:hypothetical protein|nr:hypothetical protein [Anaerolineales bacterium]